MTDMNLYPDLNMDFRSNHRRQSPGINLNSPINPQRPRLPSHIADEISRSTTSDSSFMNTTHDNLASPLRQKMSLPSFLQSPARLLEQLPASPASLLLSPLVKQSDNEQSPFFLNNKDETNLIEQVDHYFIRRRQYLQHNIDVSLNISRWVLENLIFYSVETLRRQAQLQSESSCAYLTPLSAIRMIYTMKYQQGSGVLWKGCFSSLILTATETMSNNFIDEIAPLDNPLLRIKHILLKAISSFLLIPVYSVHLLRSIQSDLTIVNHWSPLTIFIEPFQRILGIKTGFYARALPLWYLISLSLPYFVGRHALQYFLGCRFLKAREKTLLNKDQSMNINKNQFETVDDIECQLIDTIPNLVDRSFLRIEANILSVFLSNFLLYPYETVLNRLFVQGTRTIVDDLDKAGVGCTAINTRYLGLFDCCRTIFETEGRCGRGFFKGIGFLILKFGLIYASAQCLKLLIERLAIIYTQNTSELSKFHHYVISKQQQEPQDFESETS
ncbi:unnamed protein product [Rotaria socialis]|uniref:Uncharacterized protein n=1 Tax=Rotaria socialis TaxID=392032 RepID=A0A817Y7V1_9BILA|nr:unnamed protein product [Rotaria socialis]CAF3360309.1 unnamed protein product [Rotaria socialis]CAF3377143.1 unnamed protein product [Rotaria socialis]CAF3449247.1 unnamed protein product [Rotaria socialis]CAF3642449.1 unnamed protein product [Rotaria socialis]